MGKRVATPSESFWQIVTSPQARKTQVVLIMIAVSAASAGLLPAGIAVWVMLVAGVLSAAGVYAVPNAAQKLVLQPAGTAPAQADMVIETPAAAEPMVRGDVIG